MNKIISGILAVCLLGACAYYSPANRPCESKACKARGTWDACVGDGCAKAAGWDKK